MATLSSAILQLAGFRPGASGIMFTADNTADIGAAADNRPRDLHVARNTVLGNLLTVQGAATLSSSLAVAGTAYVGDTSNATVTLGLTINQGAADDSILELKSSDVAHGITGITETDTYGAFRKASATAGGLQVRGISEGSLGFHVQSMATTEATVKSTAGTANIYLDAFLKSGTSVGSHGADANLMALGSNAVMRFFWDVEGSAHADVEWTTF